jgi:plasmid stabilization system protein ParE
VDYRLLYTQRALNDLDQILGHIAEDDAEAASRFGASLLDHVDLLTRFPRLGGFIRKRSGVRKLLHSPLLVYYQVDEDKRLIQILHFTPRGAKASRRFVLAGDNKQIGPEFGNPQKDLTTEVTEEDEELF